MLSDAFTIIHFVRTDRTRQKEIEIIRESEL